MPYHRKAGRAPKATAVLLNGQLQSKGITAIVTKDRYFDKEERLKIIFEYEQAKSRDKILFFTQKFFQKLNPESISKVMVYGRKKGDTAAAWRGEISLFQANKLVDDVNLSSSSLPVAPGLQSQTAILDGHISRAQEFEHDLDYNRAILEMREAVNAYPDNVQCHRYLASLYLKSGKTTMARIHNKQALENQPEEEEALVSKDNNKIPLKAIKPSKNKSRTLAILLAFCFGGYGIHHFYLGSWGWGLVFLFLFWTNFALFMVLGIVTGIIYLFLSVEEFSTVANDISGPFNLDLYKFSLVKLLKSKNSSFELLRGLLWAAFGFFALTSPFCLFSPDTRVTGLKLAVLALITFPPAYDFVSERISNLLPVRYISKAGLRNISHISACILFVCAAIAFTPDTYTRNSSPSSMPSSDISSPTTSESQEVGTVWECYKSASDVYETLEYSTPRERPGTSCTKIK